MSLSTLAACSNLHTLVASHLPHLTDRSISSILASCTTLTSLTLSHNRSFAGTAFIAKPSGGHGAAGGGLAMSHVFSIRHLDVSYCRNLIDDLLMYVGSGMVDLVALSCCCSTRLRAGEMEALAAAVGKHLTRLDVMGWDIGGGMPGHVDQHEHEGAHPDGHVEGGAGDVQTIAEQSQAAAAELAAQQVREERDEQSAR